MTEEEWLTCTTPRHMVRLQGNRVSKRKLRLFTAACCRQIAHLFPNEGCRNEGTILEYLRGGDEHVRGCWVLDLLRAED